jgi:hypothetical protein
VRKDRQLLEEKVGEVWWTEGDKWTKEGGRMMYDLEGRACFVNLQGLSISNGKDADSKERQINADYLCIPKVSLENFNIYLKPKLTSFSYILPDSVVLT